MLSSIEYATICEITWGEKMMSVKYVVKAFRVKAVLREERVLKVL